MTTRQHHRLKLLVASLAMVVAGDCTRDTSVRNVNAPASISLSPSRYIAASTLPSGAILSAARLIDGDSIVIPRENGLLVLPPTDGPLRDVPLADLPSTPLTRVDGGHGDWWISQPTRGNLVTVREGGARIDLPLTPVVQAGYVDVQRRTAAGHWLGIAREYADSAARSVAYVLAVSETGSTVVDSLVNIGTSLTVESLSAGSTLTLRQPFGYRDLLATASSGVYAILRQPLPLSKREERIAVVERRTVDGTVHADTLRWPAAPDARRLAGAWLDDLFRSSDLSAAGDPATVRAQITGQLFVPMQVPAIEAVLMDNSGEILLGELAMRGDRSWRLYSGGLRPLGRWTMPSHWRVISLSGRTLLLHVTGPTLRDSLILARLNLRSEAAKDE